MYDLGNHIKGAFRESANSSNQLLYLTMLTNNDTKDKHECFGRVEKTSGNCVCQSTELPYDILIIIRNKKLKYAAELYMTLEINGHAKYLNRGKKSWSKQDKEKPGRWTYLDHL